MDILSRRGLWFPTGSGLRFPPAVHRLRHRLISLISTTYPPPFKPAIHSAKQRAMIPEDYLCGVVPGGAGDATARMGAGAAMIEAL